MWVKQNGWKGTVEHYEVGPWALEIKNVNENVQHNKKIYHNWKNLDAQQMNG